MIRLLAFVSAEDGTSDKGQAGRRSHLRVGRFPMKGQQFAVLDIAAFSQLKLARLTRAEELVYHYMLAGLSNQEIAGKRGVSNNTVENQVSSVFRKLGVCSRSELSVFALRAMKDE